MHTLHKFSSYTQAFIRRLDQLPPMWKGVALALCSTAMFTLVGVIVRVLSDTIDVFQILFFRQLVFITLLMPAMMRSLDILLRPKRVKLHALRILGAFIALYFGFVTVSNIPLPDATALGFTQVLFVACISKLCLSERITATRLFTIIVGFIGVMMVVQPQFQQASLQYTGAGLLAAMGAAVAVICVRKVSQEEPRITLLAYQALFVGVMALLPSLAAWQWPSWSELGLLLCVGVLSSVAQWIGVTAYKYGEANVIANVEYGKIIYSVALGYGLFSEIPNELAILGLLVIVASAALPIAYHHLKPFMVNKLNDDNKSLFK